jgi:hypothetical protein
MVQLHDSIHWVDRWLVASVAIGLLLVSCIGGASGAHWGDSGAHVVDGYWGTDEHSCTGGQPFPCTFEIDAAKLLLPATGPAVASAAVAMPPTTWVRADGKQFPEIGNAALGRPEFVIFDLADGQRRTFMIFCDLAEPDPTQPTSTQLPGDDFRVGTVPSWGQ